VLTVDNLLTIQKYTFIFMSSLLRTTDNLQELVPLNFALTFRTSLKNKDFQFASLLVIVARVFLIIDRVFYTINFSM